MPLNGPMPASVNRPEEGQADDGDDDADEDRAVDLRCRGIAEAERVAALAQSDIERRRAPRSGRSRGSAASAARAPGSWPRRSGSWPRRRGRHPAMVPRTASGTLGPGRWPAADGDRATARHAGAPTSARRPPPARRRRRSSGRARSRRPRRPPASAARSRAARSPRASRRSSRRDSQSPWNPTMTCWSARLPAAASSASR